jgi:membrane fusion protein (multidrug efflux system)
MTLETSVTPSAPTAKGPRARKPWYSLRNVNLRRTAAVALPIALIMVSVFGAFYAFFMLQARSSPLPRPTPPPPKNVAVEVVTPTPEIPDTLLLPAVVEADTVIEVAAEVPGRIVEIPCVEGSRCRAGDPLVKLDTELLQADYDRAKAEADFIASDYQRFVKLQEGGAGTEKQVDELLSRLKVSKAAVDQARARLERAHITAPSAGILDKVPVDTGEYIDTGTVVARIVNIDTVEVVVNVPEPDVHFLAKGDPAQIEFRNTAGTMTRRGTIGYISELADPRTRTTRVEISVDNADGALRSGQIVRATLTRRVLKDVIMVPLFSIIPLEEGYRVYVVEEGLPPAQRPMQPGLSNRSKPTTLARMRTITTSRLIRKGPLGIDRVQVLSGLEPGDRLIVQGHRFVGDGQPVKIVDRGLEAVAGLNIKARPDR